ncbi:MAG: hypothetical protein IJ251_02275 [Oscillospiraceae bacterium]|nr:hypothetical protein [Oscillospiraceae bacterium]
MRAVIWTVLAVIILVVVIMAIVTQTRFRKKGVKVMAHIVGYMAQNGQQFAQYYFEYGGQNYTITDYFSDDSPMPDSDREILFLPGYTKYVMREESTKIKAWQIAGIIAAAALLAVEVLKLMGID